MDIFQQRVSGPKMLGLAGEDDGEQAEVFLCVWMIKEEGFQPQ